MQTIFVLANGRSGTTFLCDLFRRNVRDCVAKHEPYFSRSRPSMFGKPVYDYCHGNTDALRTLMRRKSQGIARYKCDLYVETNHAFLKSFCDVAMESFPDMKLVHLVRHPLRTAKSEANRELAIRKYHFPFRDYRGSDGKTYFRWSLTGEEPIYHTFPAGSLSLFQKYVVQWIEIENRAMSFLERHGKHGDCFTLHSPSDLNDPSRVSAMLQFFGLRTATASIAPSGRSNRTPGFPTVVGDAEEQEFRAVVASLPAKYLDIFRREPYSQWESMPLPFHSLRRA